jgi:hypothetical protein
VFLEHHRLAASACKFADANLGPGEAIDATMMSGQIAADWRTVQEGEPGRTRRVATGPTGLVE